ncbi:hypothetical protein BDV35DRAFT_241342 [Aspergillus flavus]|uniref:Uncharacterized protein n=1 Tax=Aspergillus flavus TaxID=5059 RepID=A0A5N6GVH3_ASPFL|nr:hypothetical protein BDV35DRAFT_241342 [Aspergillus flavus]
MDEGEAAIQKLMMPRYIQTHTALFVDTKIQFTLTFFLFFFLSYGLWLFDSGAYVLNLLILGFSVVIVHLSEKIPLLSKQFLHQVAFVVIPSASEISSLNLEESGAPCFFCAHCRERP